MTESEHPHPDSWLPGQHRLTLGPVRDLPPSVQEEARAQLRPGLADWIRHTLEGVRKNERTAMNNFGRAMGILGAEVEVNIGLACAKAFGMSVDDVRQILETHRESGAASLEQCREDGIELLRWVMKQDETQAGEIRKALFGGDDALALGPHEGSDSTNGHA